MDVDLQAQALAEIRQLSADVRFAGMIDCGVAKVDNREPCLEQHFCLPNCFQITVVDAGHMYISGCLQDHLAVIEGQIRAARVRLRARWADTMMGPGVKSKRRLTL